MRHKSQINSVEQFLNFVRQDSIPLDIFIQMAKSRKLNYIHCFDITLKFQKKYDYIYVKSYTNNHWKVFRIFHLPKGKTALIIDSTTLLNTIQAEKDFDISPESVQRAS